MKQSMALRFMSKVNLDSINNCWIWTASKVKGYGVFCFNNERKLAHRASYELFVDTIPEGLTIDHLCRNHSCVNPFHLEAVTLKENIFRGDNIVTQNMKREVCSKGHPFDMIKTGNNHSYRSCYTCKRQMDKEYKLRRKQQCSVTNAD
jgi:hypothetical protein